MTCPDQIASISVLGWDVRLILSCWCSDLADSRPVTRWSLAGPAEACYWPLTIGEVFAGCSITHHINWEQNAHKLRSLSNCPARTGLISATSDWGEVQYTVQVLVLSRDISTDISHTIHTINIAGLSTLICFPSSIFHIYEKIICKVSSPPHIGLDRWLVAGWADWDWEDENPGNQPSPASPSLIRTKDGRQYFYHKTSGPTWSGLGLSLCLSVCNLFSLTWQQQLSSLPACHHTLFIFVLFVEIIISTSLCSVSWQPSNGSQIYQNRRDRQHLQQGQSGRVISQSGAM